MGPSPSAGFVFRELVAVRVLRGPQTGWPQLGLLAQ
jgi:hypothetical protein